MICNLEQTKNLAKTLAQNAKVGSCFCLTGDLGAGKTEFAKAFIAALVPDAVVTSPTFNIVAVYDFGLTSIFHFDLYRLKNEVELEEIGMQEMLQQGICLIEWPQIAANFLPANKVDINIEIVDENTRKITCSQN
jgi:tRNA threonylcarbamoyl adenosine modification protein YjeE